MNLPSVKYSIVKVKGVDEWKVVKLSTSKVIATFCDKNDAFDHVQRLVEDDVWNAANRD